MIPQHVIKVNLPGGYVAAGDLDEILAVAGDAGAQHIRFGNRQQLYFTVDADELYDMETDMLRAGITYEVDTDEHPNIISSYVCDTIFSQDSWLKEGVYRDIFDLFTYQPKLKINIADRHQTFVPFFSGNFNFISSDVSNYWYWYIRFPKTSQIWCWPSLIYSEDIPLVSKKAEEVILKNKALFYDKPNADEQLFHSMLSQQLDLAVQKTAEPLQLPDFYLPYYEGFNKYANKYWLGVYRRNELFPIEFLKDVCNQCIKDRIGQLYITPWRSVIIKGIDLTHRANWGAILDKHRLNIRHAANELNWQIEDLSAEGLALKQQLVRHLEEADVRTYGLCFCIKTRPKSGLMGSVVIKAQASGTFEILHTINFNPNSKDYITYKKRVTLADLSDQLMVLCDSYYSTCNTEEKAIEVQAEEKQEQISEPGNVYECRYCKTLYDSHYGDDVNHIPAGTLFTEISEHYECPVCGSDKQSFELVAKQAWSGSITSN